LDDNTYTNKTFACFARVPLHILNSSEYAALKILNYNVYISLHDYDRWVLWLETGSWLRTAETATLKPTQQKRQSTPNIHSLSATGFLHPNYKSALDNPLSPSYLSSAVDFTSNLHSALVNASPSSKLAIQAAMQANCNRAHSSAIHPQFSYYPTSTPAHYIAPTRNVKQHGFATPSAIPQSTSQQSYHPARQPYVAEPSGWSDAAQLNFYTTRSRADASAPLSQLMTMPMTQPQGFPSQQVRDYSRVQYPGDVDLGRNNCFPHSVSLNPSEVARVMAMNSGDCGQEGMRSSRGDRYATFPVDPSVLYESFNQTAMMDEANLYSQQSTNVATMNMVHQQGQVWAHPYYYEKYEPPPAEQQFERYTMWANSSVEGQRARDFQPKHLVQPQHTNATESLFSQYTTRPSVQATPAETIPPHDCIFPDDQTYRWSQYLPCPAAKVPMNVSSQPVVNSKPHYYPDTGPYFAPPAFYN
jgi:hypothetical protein